MMIPVNQDIDSYKDDFFKGLTMRQTLFAVAAVIVSGGLLAFFLLYLKLNASVAMYLTLPVARSSRSGSLKVHGIPLGEYLKRKKKVQQQSSFFYQPEMVFWQNQGFKDSMDMDSGERDAKAKKNLESRSKTTRKKDLRKIYLETEETILGEEKSVRKAGRTKTVCGETKSEVRSIEGNEGIQGADAAALPAAEDSPAADSNQPDLEGRDLSAGGKTEGC